MNWQRIAADKRKLLAAKCFNYAILTGAILAVVGVAPFSEFPQSVILICGALGYLGVAALVVVRMARARYRRENSN